MSDPHVVIYQDATMLGQAVAARIITAICDAQADRGDASIVLTGGGMGGAVLRELAAAPARDAINWNRLSIWWGDERFLPAGHPDRNDTQARDALLDHLAIDPARIHPMAASDGPLGDDLDAAAEQYVAELASASGGAGSPEFDVLLLGLGPDGHVASLFPDAPGLTDPRHVIPVRGAPKPPPTRISLSLPVINRAREIWIVAAGEEKAAAARSALSGPGLPAAAVHGTHATRWLLDQAAAGLLAS